MINNRKKKYFYSNYRNSKIKDFQKYNTKVNKYKIIYKINDKIQVFHPKNAFKTK